MTANERDSADDNPASSERLNLNLGARSYDIVVGEGLIDTAGEHIAPLMTGKRAIIISDDVVAPIYLERVEQSLVNAGITVASVVVPNGEMSKDFAHLENLTGDMFAASLDRTTMVVALGGGVIGDLAGFAAAITMRGLDFIQIPTTLLAQVDSSVGGKTGVNSPYGKNLIGAFHQPRLVLIDLATLDTLPHRQLLAGYAEVLKYGLINDLTFFDWLDDNAASLLSGDRSAQRHAVLTSCTAKAAVVGEDEREHGRRALLNLGHTFGHALEVETGYGGALLHGEAVAIGMVMAFEFSTRLGLCPKADAERLRQHLQNVGLPVDVAGILDSSCTAERLISHMGLDKKIDDGVLIFILARGIGDSFISRDVKTNDLESFLNEFING